MRSRPPVILLVLLLTASCGYIITTTGAMPAQVASHFDAAGYANGHMTRDGYRVFMLLFGAGFPLAMVALIAWLPRLLPNLTNIPNRTYWLAPERRDTTFADLGAYALWLGCLLAALPPGMHWLLMRANALNPPKLENGLFLALLATFLAALVWWAVALLRHFRAVAPPAR